MNIARKSIAIASLVGAIALSVPAFAETTLRMAVAWPSSIAQVGVVLQDFQDDVAEKSNGSLIIQANGPEAVPPFEQFQPLASGVFDLLYTVPNYHQAQTGVGLVLDGVVTQDVEKLRSSGVIDYLNEYYRENFGVEIIALVPSPKSQFILREPLSEGGIENMKIRSNPIYDGVVRGLGAIPVSMSPTDAYTSLQKNTLDGIAFPVHAAADFRLYEVASFMTRPTWGQSTIALMMNSDKLNSMSDGDRAILIDAALKMEHDGTVFLEELAAEQNRIMMENGVQETEFTAEQSEKIDRLFREGVLEVARKSRPDDVEAFVKFATGAGVIPQ